MSPRGTSGKKPPRKGGAPPAAGAQDFPAAGLASDAQRLTLKGRLLARILDTAEDAIISIDQNQRIILFNRGAERIFGYDELEVLGRPLDILLPAHLTRIHRQHVREFGKDPAESRTMGERSEIAGRRKDGSEFPAEGSISKVDLDGSLVFTVILRDVSERKAVEKKIRASLREKEVLLKEIHHRVKNNLQVITSLLNLQSRGAQDSDVRKSFRESQHRIHSMALIHEQLYESPDLSQINFSGYIRQLAAYLFRAYGVSSSRVGLETKIECEDLGVDVAVPCGLIINELVSNSLKYAFPDGRQGRIRIELVQEGGQATLCVADQGAGFPPEVDLWNTRTLGLRLVRTLAKQLEGHIEMQNKPGAQIRITFPARPAERTE